MNVILQVIARLTGWNYCWYEDEASGRRRLFLGDITKPGMGVARRFGL